MIKQLFPCVAALCLLASPTGFAQSSAKDWEADVRTFDTAYWRAYNECDIKTMDWMNADDMEFYHDAGGVLLGKPQFSTSMRNNICGNPNAKVRRAEIKGTVQVFPMHDNGKLYGAIVSGEHEFYNSGKETPEYLANRARFTHLLVLGKEGWKISRVLSYAHAPVPHVSKLVAIQLPAAALDRLAGKYTDTNNSVFIVERAGDHLTAAMGPEKFALYPSAANEFFLKERPITISFSPSETGEGQRLTVRERGAVVAQASTAK
jgi:Domain of unknown function (DUF4440)/Domain of unknown function (DUF3471)